MRENSVKNKWQHKLYWDRGLEEPYEVHEFIKEDKSMGMYETEEYLNELELLLKEAHDKMDGYNNELDKHIQRPMCHWCGQTGYNEGGLDHFKDCILVKIRHVIHT